MKELNWKANQAEYIKKPPFESYAGFSEKREVLVDCSFGVNPLAGLYDSATLDLKIHNYGKYPAGGPHGNRALAEFIQARWPSFAPEELCFAAGSQGAIGNLARILGGGRNKIHGYYPSFIPAMLEFAIAGVKVEMARASGPEYLLGAEWLLSTLHDDATALYLDSPNNPTGRAMPLEELAVLADACARRGVLLIVDEAYSDFVDDANSAFNLTNKNLICLRSFSKGCGLAGSRVGYVLIRDPELRALYQELGLHFSSSALACDVVAQLLPTLYFAGMRRQVGELKKQTMEFLEAIPGLHIAKTHPSTPIILLSWNKPGSLYDALMEQGIMTEPGHFFGIAESSVRLRVPAPSDLEVFFTQCLKALK